MPPRRLRSHAGGGASPYVGGCGWMFHEVAGRSAFRNPSGGRSDSGFLPYDHAPSQDVMKYVVTLVYAGQTSYRALTWSCLLLGNHPPLLSQISA